ncbi:hypothetical protein D3C78_1602070 [compost metagenome]
MQITTGGMSWCEIFLCAAMDVIVNNRNPISFMISIDLAVSGLSGDIIVLSRF